MSDKFIGVDLDRTLAQYESGDFFSKGMFHIGEPIPRMVELVKGFLAEGRTVVIFTARLTDLADPSRTILYNAIQNWCLEHIGQKLEVTNIKHHAMEVFFDDRAVGVVPNQGLIPGSTWWKTKPPSKKERRAKRFELANLYIAAISHHGRRFFDRGGVVSQFVVCRRDGQLKFFDSGSKEWVRIAHSHGRWRGFQNGGTLRACVESLRDFIYGKRAIPVFNYEHWGYSDDAVKALEAEIAPIIEASKKYLEPAVLKRLQANS